mmetsp:Transcript_38510/g.108919  ORF Transcript_38510/g.108919 Transcript_38510/m.108919 type:complete len:285 (-) Transcript_38510:352-1206(-)
MGDPSGLNRISKDSRDVQLYFSYSFRTLVALLSFQFGGWVTFRPTPTGLRAKLMPWRTTMSLLDSRPGHRKISSPFGMSCRAICSTISSSRLPPSRMISSWKEMPTPGSAWSCTSRSSTRGKRYIRGARSSRTSWWGWTTRAWRMITASAQPASLRLTGLRPKNVRFGAVCRIRFRCRTISSYEPSTVVPLSTRRWRPVSSRTVSRSFCAASSHPRKTVDGSRFSAIKGYARLRRWVTSSPVRLYAFSSTRSSYMNLVSSRRSVALAVSMLSSAALGIFMIARP